MYVLSLDLGSTNSKALVLKIDKKRDEEDIKLVGKVRKKETNFALFISEIFDTFSIPKDDIEVIVVTGTGASFLNDKYEGIDIYKVDEFNAIAYGGIILSKLKEGVVVSIGTGTTILYSNLYDVERLGGTGLGGGTFVGLSNAILQNKLADNNIKTFNELIEMAKVGDRKNVDLTIGDISKSSIGNMSLDITAANFAGTNKIFSANDLIAGVANMIIENILLMLKALNKKYTSVFIGTLVTDEFIKKRIKEVAEYTGNDVRFVENSDYAIAIGAWEYYLLKERKNY